MMKYRPEVDGLRAIAVLPVLLFHAGFAAFGGGYVGVDVFFVISGYLIATLIFQDIDAGNFSLLRFYERRARRILPALFVVLVVSLVLAWALLNPRDMKDFGASVAAVVTFLSNILFWRQTGYFQTAAELKPLLHTWSLAVEEQYYLVFPLLAWALSRVMRRWAWVVFALAALLSVALAQWGASAHPAFNFFFLHSRAWELLAGVLVAWVMLYRPSALTGRQGVRQVLAAAGLALVVLAILMFTKETPMPSAWGLIPVVGVVLILLFATADTWVGRLLGSKVLVGLGLISYSTYLWHQPLFAFARHYALLPLTPWVYLGLIGLTLVLAAITWKWIENPFRDRRRVSIRALVVCLTAIGAALLMAGALIWRFDGLPQRVNLSATTQQSLQANQLLDTCTRHHEQDGWSLNYCQLIGNTQSQGAHIAILGDSHSDVLLPVFNAMARQQHVNMIHVGLPGCAPLIGVDVIRGRYAPGTCTDLAARAMELAKAKGVRHVVFVARWTLYTDGEYDGSDLYYLGDHPGDTRSKARSRQVFAEGLERTVAAYRQAGMGVTLMAQVPQQRQDPYVAYHKLAFISSADAKAQAIVAISVPRAQHEAFQAFSRSVLEKVAQTPQVAWVNPDPVLCRGTLCPIGVPDESTYFDDDHLSATGAMQLLPLMTQKLFPVNSGG